MGKTNLEIRPKVILFVTHAGGIGGAERVLLLLMDYLKQTGWKCHLACGGGPLQTEASRMNIQVHPISLPRLRGSPFIYGKLQAGAREIARIADQIKADALYLNSVRAALYGWRSSRITRLPYVWHMHDFWLSESQPKFVWLDQQIKHLLTVSAQGVIANSQATADRLPASPKVRMIHNGIDVSHFGVADGERFRQTHQIAANTPLVGTVGRLRRWKGAEGFLRIAANIAARMPETRFIVMGGDPFEEDDTYQTDLVQLRDQMGLTHKVTFTGHLTDIRPGLSAIDVFTHCGDPEPFGLVITEAMAMAKPVVAFDQGAVPEIVKNHETGILVKPGDETGLAEAVLALLNDSAGMQQMGQMGRSVVKQQFTVSRMGKEIASLLNQVSPEESGATQPFG